MTSSGESDSYKNKQKNVSGCSQWGILILTMRMSRLLGVAPVRIQKDRPGCPTAVSKPLSFYGKVFSIFLNTCIIVGTVRDCLAGSQGVRTRSGWTRFAWFAELALLLPTTTVGAFGAIDRLSTTINYLDVVDKIKCDIEGIRAVKSSRKHEIAVCLYVLFQLILRSVDFISFYLDSLWGNKDYNVLYFYICFYLETLIVIMLELEFMSVALLACSGLKCINNALEDVIYFIDLQNSKTSERVGLYVGTNFFPVSNQRDLNLAANKVNVLVDKMSPQTHYVSQPSFTLKHTTENIRRLTVAYGTICDVIAGINDNYGLLLLLFIGAFNVQFIVTPLYFLSFWYSNKKRVISITLQILFVMVHLMYMLIAVEPGYMTEKQNERTRILARQLIQRASSPKDPILAELDLLHKQIELNKVSYTPLNFCRITRSLIIVILGGATSYVVIILQFQRMNNDDV